MFTVIAQSLEAIGVEWRYTDGSSIRVTYANEPLGNGALPRTAAIVVDTPHVKLNADATYGAYALGATVPESVLSAAK